MTSYAPGELFPVLESFKPALKSIDVRTVAVCPPSEEDWQNLITSIVVSDKTEEEVKAEHKLLPNVRNNEFVVLYQALSFDYEIFNRISNGEMRFLTPYGYNKVKTRILDPLALKVTSTVEWIGGSPNVILKANGQGDTESRKKIWEVVHQQNTFANSCGFSNSTELIKRCLKLESYDYNVQKDLEVKIKQLATIGKIQFGDKQVKVNIKNPYQLNNLQLNIDLQHYPKQVWIKPRQIDGKTNYIEVKVNEMLPLDNLNFQLIHRNTGLRIDRTDEIVPLENVTYPFLKTLEAFCPIDEFKRMLFEPEITKGKPQFNFESAVAWLLSLAGFEVIHLNSSGKTFDKLRVGEGYEKGCADIIAYEENKRLVLIDCDTGSVDPIKVQKLERTKKHFRETLKGYEKLHIVPILFTPVDFRGTSPSPDVMIADRAIIKRIFEAVVKGDREQARSVLYYSGM